MTGITVTFHPFDLRNASDAEHKCLNDFKNKMNREYRPDDPPIPLDEFKQKHKTMPQFIEYEAYAGWNDSNDHIIAYCEIDIYNTGVNEHLVDFIIEILPEYRRQGIGRQALSLLLPFAKKHDRRLWFSYTTDRIPESVPFFERLDGRKGLEARINQLKVSEFDRNLPVEWLKKSDKLGDEFELGYWNGAYPDDHLQEISALYEEVANDQPRDDLEMEDMKFSPELLRDFEQNMFARGDQRWTLYITDRSNKKIAGLTEVIWNPNRKMILQQGFTGVYPAYRSKGLGRWLKAEMIQKVLRERPDVEYIRTGNANSNAPMLKINIEMGFKPYIANTIWQVETDKVEKYLGTRK
ncbi:MAG TPA: GNAT family N-acetyltransferase [Anaerolineales bacterium]